MYKTHAQGYKILHFEFILESPFILSGKDVAWVAVIGGMLVLATNAHQNVDHVIEKLDWGELKRYHIYNNAAKKP